MLYSTRKLNRVSAAFVHFLLSCFIFTAFIFLLLFQWYPSPFFSASGGWQGLQLVVLVDLVLGPVLTLIVYNPEKSHRELFIDLSAIVVVQLSAMIWGIINVYHQRPVAAVYWAGSFYTVPAQALESQGEDLRQLEQFGKTNPVFVFAEPPRSQASHEKMLRDIAATKVPPHEQMDRYRVLGDNFGHIRSAGVDVDEIIENNEEMRLGLEEILERTGTSRLANYYIPLISRYRNIILVFSNENELIGMLNAPLKEGPQ